MEWHPAREPTFLTCARTIFGFLRLSDFSLVVAYPKAYLLSVASLSGGTHGDRRYVSLVSDRDLVFHSVGELSLQHYFISCDLCA